MFDAAGVVSVEVAGTDGSGAECAAEDKRKIPVRDLPNQEKNQY